MTKSYTSTSRALIIIVIEIKYKFIQLWNTILYYVGYFMLCNSQAADNNGQEVGINR